MAGKRRPMATRRAQSNSRQWSWPRALLATCMVLAAAVLLLQFWYFCKVFWYSLQPPQSTPIMRAAMRELRVDQPTAQLQYTWANYDAISNTLKRAVVAAEDANFVQHGGVEWEAIRKAWEYNQQQEAKAEAALAAGKSQPRQRMRGGSTITQQLAKNLFLSNSRSYFRKGQELVITWMIEHVMTKQRILELYLNVAEWGEGIFGAQAAARHYFKADAARLSNAQAARLAAMLPNPRFYDRRGVTRYLSSRTQTLQRRMQQVAIP